MDETDHESKKMPRRHPQQVPGKRKSVPAKGHLEPTYPMKGAIRRDQSPIHLKQSNLNQRAQQLDQEPTQTMNNRSRDLTMVIGVLPTCDAVGLQGQHNSTSWERRFHCRISGCPNNGGRGYLRSTILGHFNTSHSQGIRSNPIEKAKAMTIDNCQGWRGGL